MLVVDGVDQFPKRDFTAGWAAGCVAVMELVEAVPLLVKPGKTDAATVVLLVDPPNIEDVLLEETVEAGLVVVRDEGSPKPAPVVASPKMGLKFWTGGLLSGVDVAEEVVVVTVKMGLNPEASRGLALLAGAVAVAVTVLDAEEALVIWLGSPNIPAPATGAVLLGALET